MEHDIDYDIDYEINCAIEREYPMDDEGDPWVGAYICDGYKMLQRAHELAVRRGRELLGHTEVHIADPVEIWNSYTIPRQKTPEETNLAKKMWVHRTACASCRRHFGYNN